MMFKYVGKYPIMIWEEGQGINVIPGEKYDLKVRPSHKFIEEKRNVRKINIQKEVKEDVNSK